MKRIFWADALRALSIFMVVVVHSSAKVLYEWGSVVSGDLSIWAWNFANILNSFSRISVPLFVMLSGAFLLNKNEGVEIFFRKRIPRIVVPWMLWRTIQLFYNFDFSVSEIISNNFAGKVIATYFGGFWFMPMILGLYLLTPIIKPFAKTAKTKEFIYFFSLWFLFASLIPTLNQTFGKNISFQLPIFIQYIGYFVAGYFFVHKTKFTKTKLDQNKILFLTTCLVITLGTFSFTQLNGQFNSALYEYLSIFVVTASFTGFLSLKSYFETSSLFKSRELQLKISKISQASLGIFLSHALILDILTKGKLGITVHATIVNPFLALPMTILLVFFLAFLIVLALKRLTNYFLLKFKKFLI